jgi:hypothetical protein
MTPDQRKAVEAVAKHFGWDTFSVRELGLLMWCLVRYFVIRNTI